jgi:hypothetical protein
MWLRFCQAFAYRLRRLDDGSQAWIAKTMQKRRQTGLLPEWLPA